AIGREQGEVHAAGIDDCKLEQAAVLQGRNMLKANAWIVRWNGRCAHCCRIGRIDQRVDLRAYALDNSRVDLPIEGLRSAIDIGMRMHDGGTSAGASDTLADNGIDRVWNPGLQRPAPGAVQRDFNPDLPHPLTVSVVAGVDVRRRPPCALSRSCRGSAPARRA